MKKSGVVITAILSIFLLVSLASAADVAYLYKKNSQVDDNVLAVFNELSLTVDLIQENSLPNNFNSYKLIYVGKENYRNNENFPVNNYPSVISNRNPSKSWGLTDSNGVSQMGSTSPLSVVVNSNSLAVYTQGLKENKVAVSYYYLGKDSKAQSLQQIAATKTTSSGVKFGDVVSYAEAGAQLLNGKTQKKNLCFFGIVESDYWTPEAKNLFKECINFAVGTVQPAPECTNNTECPAEQLSQPFCQNNNVYKTKTTSSCVENKCVPSGENVSVETCLFGCESGACKPAPTPIEECNATKICNSTFSEPFCQNNNVYKTQFNSSCVAGQCVASSNQSILITVCPYGCSQAQCLQPEIHDVALIDFANSTNKIRIKDAAGIIISNNQLQCNSKYKFEISAENKGNFTEDVSFAGSIGSLELNHNSISNFSAGEKTTTPKSKTINMTLTEGYYNISIEAILDGFTDANPSNNKALREIFVSC
ncbi:hypothetical protein J4402_01460 [Candidatus Pacearchaeota archaeon]|nr:hypothetical protein [Candidatus Pacearchaeota archaeon]